MILSSEFTKAFTEIDLLSPPRQYIAEILRAVCDNMGYCFGSVIAFDAHGQLSMVSSFNLPQDYPEQVGRVDTPLLSSPSGEALATGNIVVVNETLSDPRLEPWREMIRAYDLKTIIWVPLMSKGEALGTYVLYDNKVREVPEAELRILEQIAISISVGIASNRYLNRLNKKTEELQHENAERAQLEEERNRIIHDMGERVKELACVYDLSESIRKRESFEEVLQDVVNLIPPSWHYPEITRGKVVFDHREYVSEPLEETEWKLSADIVVNGKCRGSIEVYYLEECPTLYEGPFMKEERELVDGIARSVSEDAEHRQIQKELQESEERHRLLYNNALVSMFTTTLDGRPVAINDFGRSMLGYSSTDQFEREFESTKHWVNPDVYAVLLKELVARGEIHHFQTELLTRKGVKFWAELSLRIDRKKDTLEVAAINITGRKRAEEAMKEYIERLYKLSEASFDGIVVVEKGVIQEANQTFAELYEYDLSELIGMHALDFIAPESREIVSQHIRAGFDEAYEATVQKKNGARFQVEACGTSITYEGRPARITAMRDITARKRAEKALEDAKVELEHRAAELERSNQELEDFAYIASHDLKEPLRGIRTYSEFLIEDCGDKIDADGRKRLETLVRLTSRMETLLDDLLSYSRVGRAELAFKDTDLKSLVEEIIDSLHITLNEQGAVVTLADDLPSVVCDRARVGEVFRNLITNGVKYNTQENKQIEIGWHSPNSGEDSPVFFVRDNGIGIREKHHARIFKIFKRLHGRDKFGGGSGSGLTISQKIIERHGGRIWLESEYGRGSTFFFTLKGQIPK